MITECMVLNEIHQPLEFSEIELLAKDRQVLVENKASALNHRDLWITKGQYANIQLPCILGSDGSGIYEGKDILYLPATDWGNNPNFQGKGYNILGMPSNGTFSKNCFIYPDQMYHKPEHLSYVEAAALPLAGLTAWRALKTKGQAKPGENILISGTGGGVAIFVLQFAVAMGLNVYVTSSSEEKLHSAYELGAKGGINYKEENLSKKLLAISEGFDIVVDSAGGPNSGQLLKACRSGARMVMYGGTKGDIQNFSPQILFWKQISLLGTTMGTPQEFREMLDFVSKHKIKPVIDSIYELRDVNEALKRMESGNHFGKIVLNTSR